MFNKQSRFLLRRVVFFSFTHSYFVRFSSLETIFCKFWTICMFKFCAKAIQEKRRGEPWMTSEREKDHLYRIHLCKEFLMKLWNKCAWKRKFIALLIIALIFPQWSDDLAYLNCSTLQISQIAHLLCDPIFLSLREKASKDEMAERTEKDLTNLFCFIQPTCVICLSWKCWSSDAIVKYVYWIYGCCAFEWILWGKISTNSMYIVQ